MTGASKKTLGTAIDEIVAALDGLEQSTRVTAIRAACEHLGITAPISEEPAPASGSAETVLPVVPAGKPPAPPPSTVIDIRTFKEQKRPTNAIEMACVVAYYLDSLAPPAEQIKEVVTSDIEKYFKQAGYRLPKRMPQLLVNARASGYFDSAGHAKYKLNPVGYNLVVHSLPRKTG
jgi:hypothetical protein